MYSIGEFSKICKVTTRTLRHYDDIGIIKPVLINEENNYRYYEADQIRIMNIINKLKKYHFSLEEIKEIMEHDDDRYTIERLKNKKNELEKILNEYIQCTNELNSEINDIENGRKFMITLDDMKVEVINDINMNIVSSRQHMSVNEYGRYIGKLYELVYKNKMTITGYPMSVYYGEEFDPLNNDTEVALEVKEQNEFTRTIKYKNAVKCTVIGEYNENLSVGHIKLNEWIKENRYEISGTPFEKYLTKPDDKEIITEIYYPFK